MSMDEKLKRRLAGAAVLLLIAFIVVSLLPTPQEAARQVDGEVVTIALRDDVINEPGETPRDAAAAPEALPESAPSEIPQAASGRDQAGDIDAASGDDDGAGDAPAAPPVKPQDAAPAVTPPKIEPAKPAPAKPLPPVAEVPKPAAKPEAAAKPEPAKPQAPPPTVEAAPAPAKPAEAPQPADTPKPAAPAVAAPPPASKPPAGGGSWYVQIGGFADIANARQAQDKAKAAGQGSILAPIDTAKGTLYRVRAGPYASREAAQAAQGALAGKGFPDAKLVGP